MITHRRLGVLAFLMLIGMAGSACRGEYFSHRNPFDPATLDSVRVIAIWDTLGPTTSVASFVLKSYPRVTGYPETWGSGSDHVQPTTSPGIFIRVASPPTDTVRVLIWGGYPGMLDTAVVVLVP